MTQLNGDLLSDLGRLVRRYPEEDWTLLIDYLSDQKRRGEIISLLTVLAKASGETGRRRKRAPRETTIRDLLAELAATDSEKAQFLDNLRRRLVDKDVLPTSADLRAMSDVLGLPTQSSKMRREQMVNVLIRDLVNHPLDRIVATLSAVPRTSRDLGAEYERWVDLILKWRRPEP